MPLNGNVTGPYLCPLTSVAQSSFKPAETWKKHVFSGASSLWFPLLCSWECVLGGEKDPPIFLHTLNCLHLAWESSAGQGNTRAIADAVLGAESLPRGERKYCNPLKPSLG